MEEFNGFLNDEQIHATLDALDREAEGYQARIAQAKLAGDKNAETRYKNRRGQVADEHERVAALVGRETPVTDDGQS